MIERRTAIGLALGAVIARPAIAQPSSAARMSAAFFYQSVGPVLATWQADATAVTLTRASEVTLPANIQYVWRHPAQRVLYVASSNGGPDGPGDRHFANAFTMDPETGALRPHGEPARLRARPIHISVDRAGAHALIAYNNPSGVSVHRIGADGMLGEEVAQAVTPDGGIYGHQVLAAPDNATVILVTRGNDAAGGKPEDPGALKVFAFRDGQLTLRQTVAPDGGRAYGPRHIDFHPTLPIVFVSLERQNKLHVHGLRDGTMTPEPIFTTDTLQHPGALPPQQSASTLHVHPNGRHLYLANRSDAMGEYQGQPIALDGENSVTVFDLDPATGRPTLVQSVDTRGFHPRTFSLDPTARMLVAADITGRRVRQGDGTVLRPANLALYRVGADGRLAFVNSIPVETGNALQFWTGMVRL
ncbi:MAG TPA: beta-propeller fold lactonase family protein [Roseomonas sp.]|jgi:6-phosphogluconolactonase (cycloisomerase 2 family)